MSRIITIKPEVPAIPAVTLEIADLPLGEPIRVGDTCKWVADDGILRSEFVATVDMPWLRHNGQRDSDCTLYIISRPSTKPAAALDLPIGTPVQVGDEMMWKFNNGWSSTPYVAIAGNVKYFQYKHGVPDRVGDTPWITKRVVKTRTVHVPFGEHHVRIVTGEDRTLARGERSVCVNLNNGEVVHATGYGNERWDTFPDNEHYSDRTVPKDSPEAKV